MQTKITIAEVKKLAIGETIRDTEIRGFLARRLPSGKVSFGYQYQLDGKRSFVSLGTFGVVTVDQARSECRKHAGKLAAKVDPVAERREKAARSQNTVGHVLDRWLVEHVERKALRSGKVIAAQLDRHVRPKLGDVVVYDLKRSQITACLADIESVRVGDLVLGHLRCALAWWCLNDDKFVSPIVRGMRARPVARDRILDDEELRDLWAALAEVERDKPDSMVPAYFRTLLLSACRRCEVSGMHEREIENGKWTIPASRYKTKRDHIVPLGPALCAVLPRGRGFLFGAQSRGWDWIKREVDTAIAAVRERDGRPAMPRWTIHDIRRTAASLMARAAVRQETIERVLGHVIGGVAGIYNRHQYEAEKAEALTALAATVASIVHPGAATLAA